MRVLSAEKVKKLPVGTDVYLVNDTTGEKGRFWVFRCGIHKMLKGVLTNEPIRIRDLDGMHFEVE